MAYFGIKVHPRACGEHVNEFARSDFAHGSSPRLRGTFLIVTDCYSVGYMILKIGTSDLAPDLSPTSAKYIHIIQAKRIRDGDHQNPQVSGDLCQRFQTQNPRHWGQPKQSRHRHRR